MALSDIALSALLQAKSEAAQRPLPSEIAVNAIPQAISNYVTIANALSAIREREARYGTPARGFAPAVSVGAPPPDVRRRILGIPIGMPPQAMQIQPAMAGQAGGPGLDTVPPELLTPEVRAASLNGTPVYFRPASANYQPAQIGLDELKDRTEILKNVGGDNSGGVGALLTEPDRAKAFQGLKVRVKTAGAGDALPVTNDLRNASQEVFGFDQFGGQAQTDSKSVRQLLDALERKRRPTTKYTEVRLQQILKKGDVNDLNQLSDDLRTELVNDANYVIRLSDQERAQKQSLLQQVTQRRLNVLGIDNGAGAGGGAPKKKSLDDPQYYQQKSEIPQTGSVQMAAAVKTYDSVDAAREASKTLPVGTVIQIKGVPYRGRIVEPGRARGKGAPKAIELFNEAPT